MFPLILVSRLLFNTLANNVFMGHATYIRQVRNILPQAKECIIVGALCSQDMGAKKVIEERLKVIKVGKEEGNVKDDLNGRHGVK